MHVIRMKKPPGHRTGGKLAASKRPQGRLTDPTPVGDDARGSKLPYGSLGGAKSERFASREVDKKTWGGPAFP